MIFETRGIRSAPPVPIQTNPESRDRIHTARPLMNIMIRALLLKERGEPTNSTIAWKHGTEDNSLRLSRSM